MKDVAANPRHRIDEGASCGGDAGGTLQDIESRPLRAQNPPQLASNVAGY
jgi:hypothetical protein